MKGFIRKLVVGNQTYFGSWTEYRQVILSGQYGIIAICGLMFYSLLEISSGYIYNIPIYFFGILIIAAAIGLHRNGNHCLANTLLYPTLVLFIYLFTSSESMAKGGTILYIPVTIGAFASFDYKHRKLALMIAGFACLLFLTTYFDFHVLPWRTYSNEETLVNLLLNFCIAFPASLLAVYMLIRLSHRNASKLVESNRLLQKSNEELDRFMYSTSHDLRAPLASLLGLIELTGRTDKPEEARKYLNLMEGRVNALDYFIKEITDYSRNSRTEINTSSFDLYKLNEEIWNSLKFSQVARDIRFEIAFEPGFIVSSDMARLKIILGNLISNSIRYHDASKSNKYIRVNCRRTDHSFILSVEDNGQGIDPEYQTKIFQMFFRANEASTGSGLGLYIVQETLERLSGRVLLKSSLKEGSTFTVNIPHR
jgi:signal transduction histidine kinase